MVENILSEIEHGVRGEVTKIRGPGEFHRRLLNAGLYCGRIVRTERIVPAQDYIQVHVNGRIIQLSSEEAARIRLEILK